MEPSWKPNRKVTYGALWGVASSVLISQAERIGVQLTPEEAAIVVTAIVSGVAYLTRRVKDKK